MAIFKSSPEKSLQRDRDAALSNRDRLAARLTSAEDNVIATKSAAQRAAIDGNDALLDTAEHAEAAALRRLTTILAAHTEAEQVLASLDAQIAAALDKTLRTATAAQTNALADEFLRAAKTFDAAITILADISDRAVPIVYEASGLANFSASSRTEVPAAAEIVATLLRDHAKMVLAGMAPAILPTPEKPNTPTIAAQPVTTRVFATRAISWTDAEGNLRYVGRYNDADLPPETAARALRLKACVPLDDPARRQQKGTWPGHPDPTQCFSVDEPSTMAPAAPNEPVQFERLDCGKPYVVRTAAGGVV
jgi:hypothetical protein